MRGKLAKELRGIAKGMVENGEDGTVASTYKGGSPPQFMKTPSGQYIKSKRGVPRTLTTSCERYLYKKLKGLVHRGAYSEAPSISS